MLGGSNVYVYANNNPVTLFDQDGLTPQDSHFGINDAAFWKWWEANKYEYGPFDRSEPGFKPDKPHDLPNRQAADRYYEEYQQCKARDARDEERWNKKERNGKDRMREMTRMMKRGSFRGGGRGNE